MLYAGFGKTIITPRVGAALAGFAAREGFCEGVHDELCARSLVIENDGAAIAFVSLDVLAVSSEFSDRVRERIQKRTGIDKNAVMIASTHTHAGPVTIKTFFNPDGSLDSDYMNMLAEAIENSVAMAWDERFAARVGVGSGHIDGIGVNRRTPDKKPIDEEIGIIRIDDQSGNLRGALINYACHPTVLGSNNLLATGDFPHFTVDKIEREIGGGFAMFVNGTQGNISMGHTSELSAIGVITPGRTFEHAEELGERLANAALEAIGGIRTDDSAEISTAVSVTHFPLKDLPNVETSERNLLDAERELREIEANGSSTEKVMRAKSKRLYASITDYYARDTAKLADGHLPVELQAIRINSAMFLAVPAEVFVEIGLSIKQRSSQKTFIVGIANGYIGYFTTAAAYPAGGYEVVSSKVAPQSESILYEEATRIEDRLFGNEGEGQQV